MHIIPAIDIIDGKCVRLTRGDYTQKTVYHSDPLDAAKMFQDWGLRRLHLVDLDGAREQHIINYRVLERIAAHTSPFIDFGGGIKSSTDLELAFSCGASMVTGGSIAVKDPSAFLEWLHRWGPERIILGADHLSGRIATTGWTEQSSFELDQFISSYSEKGIRYVISTDISKDGMLTGTSHEDYSRLLQKIPGIKLIASGGVSDLDELKKLRDMGLFGSIVGKAVYEGHIGEKEIRKYLENRA